MKRFVAAIACIFSVFFAAPASAQQWRGLTLDPQTIIRPQLLSQALASYEAHRAEHLKGDTIAELGSGNYPLDMVAFRWEGKDRIWVVNSMRGLLMINVEDLEKPLPSIATQIEGTAGIPFQHLRNQGILQAENYGDQHLLVLVRNSLNGELSLQALPFDRL